MGDGFAAQGQYETLGSVDARGMVLVRQSEIDALVQRYEARLATQAERLERQKNEILRLQKVAREAERKVAAVLALADEWENAPTTWRHVVSREEPWLTCATAADHIRAALDTADPTSRPTSRVYITPEMDRVLDGLAEDMNVSKSDILARADAILTAIDTAAEGE
jgi:hypothetical protein